MPISPFTTGVNSRPTPINYDFLGNLQNQQLNAYSQVKQKEHEDYLQGEALAESTNMLLGSVKAYSKTDEERLRQLRNVYSSALQNKIASTKGDYSQLVPFAKQLRSDLTQNLQSGELGQIQIRYDRAMKNRDIVEDMILKGDYGPDWYQQLAAEDYLNPIPKYTNIGDWANKYVDSKATENKSWEYVYKNTINAAMENSEISRQLGMAKAYDAKIGTDYTNPNNPNSQYQKELRSVVDAVNNKYRVPDPDTSDSSGTSTPFRMEDGFYTTPLLDQGFESTFDKQYGVGSVTVGGTRDPKRTEVYDRVIPVDVIKALGLDTEEKKLDHIRRLDAQQKKTAYKFQPFVDEKQKKAYNDKFAGHMLDNVPVYMFGNDEASSYYDIIKDMKDDDAKKFRQEFELLGPMVNNPYMPGAFLAMSRTADNGEPIYMAVGNPNLDKGITATLNTLYNEARSREARLENKTPIHQIGDNIKFQARAIAGIDTWGYEIDYTDSRNKDEDGLLIHEKLSPTQFIQRLQTQ